MTREKLLETAKPILFNMKMVRAILEGKKTVTRRVVKFPVNRFTRKIPKIDDVLLREVRSEKVCFHEEPFFAFDVKTLFERGDILYVRETWTDWCCEECDFDCVSDNGNGSCTVPKYLYRADGSEIAKHWRPSIHMPKDAARIFLKVIDVRVERLQDITEEQARKEGCYHGPLLDGSDYKIPALLGFPRLWDSTVKKSDVDKYGWDVNPYVFVIEFEKMEVENGKSN